MSYSEAKEKYAVYGVDTEAAIGKLKTVPVSLHCWQGDDVRGFDTDPAKPLTGGIQTTGNYPGRARTPKEMMADLDEVLFFSHPKCDPLTLSSEKEETRRFWIEHGKASIRISRYLAEELGQPCVMNIWTGDGFKNIPADRMGASERSDRIFF